MHIGFPTPFPTRGSVTQPHCQSIFQGDGNDALAVHQKPIFMVHVRHIPHGPGTTAYSTPLFKLVHKIFMFTLVQDRLVTSIRKSLPSNGLVFLQSNVAEVAAYMLENFTRPCHASQQQMSPMQSDNTTESEQQSNKYSRHGTWLEQNPFMACSETEAVTMSSGRMVWRCLLRVI